MRTRPDAGTIHGGGNRDRMDIDLVAAAASLRLERELQGKGVDILELLIGDTAYRQGAYSDWLAAKLRDLLVTECHARHRGCSRAGPVTTDRFEIDRVGDVCIVRVAAEASKRCALYVTMDKGPAREDLRGEIFAFRQEWESPDGECRA